MTRRVLNLASAVSLLLAVGAAALWVRSCRKRSAVEFERRAVRWELASDRGSLRLDNEPQRRLEAEATARARARLMEECVRLSHESASLGQRLSQTPVADRPTLEAEIGRVRAMSVANRNERAASMARPASTTPLEAYATPYFAVAGGAGLLPVLSLALTARSARRKRSRRRNDLCASCGHDLRATPNRYPECGSAAR